MNNVSVTKVLLSTVFYIRPTLPDDSRAQDSKPQIVAGSGDVSRMGFAGMRAQYEYPIDRDILSARLGSKCGGLKLASLYVVRVEDGTGQSLIIRNRIR